MSQVHLITVSPPYSEEREMISTFMNGEMRWAILLVVGEEEKMSVIMWIYSVK